MMPRKNARGEDPKKGDGKRTSTLYRVWIARYEHWAPESCSQVPPSAIAQELAEEETMSACQATRYVEAFNRAALARHRKLWAIALPVTMRFEGEPHPGDTITVADNWGE